jgi:hypothetical protein
MALVAVLCLVSAAVCAQDPTVTVYFDPAWTQRTMDCPGSGVGTLYVVAENWNMFMAGIEFKIVYPPSMTWLSDINIPPVTIGTSPQGLSMGWALPMNAFGPIEVMRVLVFWNCTDCSAKNQRVEVVAHPLFGFVRAARFPDYELVNGGGRTSVVCSDVQLDIKPGSCPNPFNGKLFEWAEGENPKKGGVLPVAVLGSSSLDVSDIDISSLRLEGVAPLTKGGPNISDVAGPAGSDVECACTTAGPDGYPDIMMRFQSQEIATAIAPGMEGDRELTLTGTYLGGIPFEATDCIRIHGTPDGYQFADVPELGEAVPNPFNPSTRLTFFVPEAAQVRLAVYDVTGRRIAELVNGSVDAGEHTIEWDAKRLASGIYFARLETGDATLVKRLVLLK